MTASLLMTDLKALGKLARLKDYPFHDAVLTSVTIQEYAYKKNLSSLPTMARGLFMQCTNNNWSVALRGYDKFFNIGENTMTSWDCIEKNCTGPFHVTLKINGCIIFASVVNGHLAVTSKHSMGPVMNQPVSHSQKGHEWINVHLERSGKSQDELIAFLSKENITAVFEVLYSLT